MLSKPLQPPRKPSAPSEASSGHLTNMRPVTADSSVHEYWRDQHVARGVPKFEKSAKPRSQARAHSEDDVALLLKERGHLMEAPEPPETNFLKALFRKKTEWVYCPIEEGKSSRRQALKDTETISNKSTWTNAGRLVGSGGPPPRRAIPQATDLSPVQRLNMRTPMTRSEVTELRLIENAMAGPPPPMPDFTVDSLETWRRWHPPNKQCPAGSVRSSSSTVDSEIEPLTVR